MKMHTYADKSGKTMNEAVVFVHDSIDRSPDYFIPYGLDMEYCETIEGILDTVTVALEDFYLKKV